MLVVDAAAAVDSLSGLDGTEALRAMLATHPLHSPDLIDYEVVSALRGMTLRGAISADRARDALTDFADLPLRRWRSDDGLRRRAFELRENLSAYDASYVALAEALRCPLLTRDARLARAAGQGVEVLVR